MLCLSPGLCHRERMARMSRTSKPSPTLEDRIQVRRPAKAFRSVPVRQVLRTIASSSSLAENSCLRAPTLTSLTFPDAFTAPRAASAQRKAPRPARAPAPSRINRRCVLSRYTTTGYTDARRRMFRPLGTQDCVASIAIGTTGSDGKLRTICCNSAGTLFRVGEIGDHEPRHGREAQDRLD